MKVTIETISHAEQRYPTVGDWLFDAKGDLTIKVSQLSDWRLEMLVAIHELAEVLICKHRGITQEEVDKFDAAFESSRPDGDRCEPGDDPGAPYVREHCVATGIERVMAAELDVNWKQYERELEDLP